MARRNNLPSEALDDVRKLLRLSTPQLESLDSLFSQAESAFPFQASFVNKVVEALRVDVEDAQSIVAVCHFLLRRPEARDDDEFVNGVLADFREILEDKLPDDEKSTILDSFKRNQEILRSLATPKPAPLRAQKIRRLASGPESRFDSIQTICQLRPLFDGPAHAEKIEGLVPIILVSIELEDSAGKSSTVTFGMDEVRLADLEDAIKRTREKLEAIRERYNADLFSAE